MVFLQGINSNGYSPQVTVALPNPKATNIVVTPGPTSLTITWTPPAVELAALKTAWYIRNASGWSTRVNSPSAIVNYSDLQPNVMLMIRNKWIHTETNVYFYTGPPTTSPYIMGPSNNNWMILVLLVILFLLLKKK